MHLQAVSNTPARTDLAPFAVTQSLGHHGTGHIMGMSSLHTKAAGETLFAEGHEADSVYEVVRGMVRLYKLLADGRRLITGFLSAGQLLDLAPEGIWAYTGEAITEVTVCRYKRTVFERLIDEVPGFARRLLSATSNELRTAQERMLLLGRKGAAEKVASFLLMMADQQGGDGAEHVNIPMSRNDIADYLGLTIETVSRTLTRLKQDGLIALPKSVRIEIRDRARLEELAGGESGMDS